jgi:hypothetical protein
VLRRIRTSKLALAWGTCALLSSAPCALAQPSNLDVDAACMASYTSAQRLRLHAQLREARKHLLACLHPSCSPVLRRDCATWLGEVEELTPSVVIAARDPSGHPTRNVRVSVDGEVVTDSIQDVPLGVDPGLHTLRFEMAGARPVETPYVIREGQKAIPIEVLFTADAAATPAPPPPPPQPQPQGAASLPPAAYALGIGGAVALVTGVAFEAIGLSQRSALDSCKGHCSPGQVDGARETIAIGDVVSVLALASLGTAAYFAFIRPRSSQGAKRVDVLPFAGGVMMHGTF